MTTLKRIYDSKDAIPAEHLGFYKENGEGGKWTLDIEVEGTVPATRLTEFRTNNTKLKARLEEYGDKEFGGGEFTPARMTELVEMERDLGDEKLVKPSEVKKQVEDRTKEARQEFERSKQKLEGETKDLRTKLTKALIESKALEAAIPFGLRKTAHEDLIDRVLKVFTLDENGNVVAFEEDGKTVKRGADDEPLRLKDYVKKLTENAKHLFEDNGGGGGDSSKTGSRDRIDGNELNPWNPESLNRQRQTEVILEDPEKAIRMAAKFGVPLQISDATRARAKKKP